VKDVRPETVVAHPELELVDAKVALIQALIPVALAAVGELLTTEVTRLVGRKHSRTEGTPGYVRWGRPPGSIYLADQKVPLTYPRVGIACAITRSRWPPPSSSRRRAPPMPASSNSFPRY